MSMIKCLDKVVSNFTDNRSFYEKICKGFCHNILKKVP